MPDSLKIVQRLQREKHQAEKKNDLKEVAKLCNILGDLLKEQGELEDAISQHIQELDISTTLDDKMGCAIAHRKIGECQCELGNFKEALKHQRLHLELATENSDLEEEQRALATIGRTFLYQAESLRDRDESHNALQSAESAFLKSMAVCGKLQSIIDTKEYMQMKARLLLNLGLVHDNKGNTRTCAEYIKRAIKISEMYSLHDDLYRCQFCLAGIYQRSGDVRGAVRLLVVAGKCAQKLSDNLKVGEIHLQKAMLFIQLRDFSAAKRCSRKAKKIGSPNAEEAEKIVYAYKTVLKMNHCSVRLDSDELTDDQRLKLYETLGDCAANIGQYTSAVKFYMDMLQVAESLKKLDSAFIPIYVSLAQTYFDMKQYTDAVVFYQRELQCRHDDHNQICRTWLNIAEAQELDGATYETVKETYNHAMESAKKARHLKLQVHVLRSLSILQGNMGDTDAKSASQKQLQTLCEANNIDADEDLSDCEDMPHEPDSEDEDIGLEDFSDSDSSNAEEEFDNSRVSEGTGGSRTRRIRKLKVNEKGETPLHRACIDGKLNMVKTLVEGGHMINPRDNCGWLPLHEAANYGYTDIVTYLLEHNARINDRGGDGCGGITPLHDACNCGNVDVIRLLVDRGANVHAKDNEGNTPLTALMDYHRSNSADLGRQEIAELKAVQQLLRRTMQGNNPHLESMSRLEDMVQSGSEDDLPCIRQPPRRQATSSHKRSRQDVGRDRESEKESEEEDAPYRKIDKSIPENPLPATAVYRDAICAVGSVATRVSQVHAPSVAEKSAIGHSAALIPEEENIVDDWLIDDVLPRKRQRIDISAVFTDLRLRKQHEPSEKRSHPEPDDFDTDSDDVMLSSSPPCPQLTIDGEDTASCSHVSQIQFGAGSNTSRKSAKRQQRIDTFARPSHHQGHRSVLPPNSIGSSQRPVSDVSINQQVAAVAVMRLRINVEGKVILVPMMPSNEPRNITWLAREASNRYFQLFNLRPVLSLATKDGAMLSPDDQIISVFSNNEEVLATVTSWDLLPLPTRYTQACQSLKTTSYHNIRNQLQACASSNDLDLTDLALRSQRFLPVARALQCEHRLKELHLNGNRLGDSGLESLCQIAPTIPNLGTLNLACNEITQVGLKKLADCLQVLPSDGKEAPFQVLEVLNLSFNPLGDSCMLSLAMILHKLSALSTLGLASCDFTQKLFQHHRLALAESMQDHHLQSVDFSSNQLSSTGIELLLMCCKASTLQSINISSVVSSYHGNYIAKHVQAFVSQSDCALETLVLRDCCLSPGCLPDICRVLTDAKFLHTLDLSANGKLNGLTLTALLTEAARCATCRLTVLRCCGCTMSSPLLIDFIDSVTEKLSHETPLKELTFTCNGLSANDFDTMKQIWTQRWSDSAVCEDMKQCCVRLTVQQDN